MENHFQNHRETHCINPLAIFSNVFDNLALLIDLFVAWDVSKQFSAIINTSFDCNDQVIIDIRSSTITDNQSVVEYTKLFLVVLELGWLQRISYG